MGAPAPAAREVVRVEDESAQRGPRGVERHVRGVRAAAVVERRHGLRAREERGRGRGAVVGRAHGVSVLVSVDGFLGGLNVNM